MYTSVHNTATATKNHDHELQSPVTIQFTEYNCINIIGTINAINNTIDKNQFLFFPRNIFETIKINITMLQTNNTSVCFGRIIGCIYFILSFIYVRGKLVGKVIIY